MPKKPTKIKVCSKTVKGRKITNEDFLRIEQFKVGRNEAIVAALADGMGGHLAGEIASKIAAENFVADLKKTLREKKSEKAIRNAILMSYNSINQEILEAEKKNSEAKNMGTTLTGLIVIGRRLMVCSLGDTRAYRIREEEIHQITRDHSAGAESLQKGLITEIEARKSQYANSLTKYLGSTESFEPDIFPSKGFMTANKGEVLILCTDGISRAVDEIDIYEQIVQTRSIEEAAQNLIYLSYTQGSKDNMSVILGEIPSLSRKKPILPVYPDIITLMKKKQKKLKKRKKRFFVVMFIFLLLLEAILILNLFKELRKDREEKHLLKKDTEMLEKQRLAHEKVGEKSLSKKIIPSEKSNGEFIL